jgi:hypothetical protein
MTSLWRESAACSHPAVDSNWFVDAFYNEGPGKQMARLYRAAEVCHTCPVQAECLAEGLLLGEDGVWGKHMLPARKEGGRRRPRQLYTEAEDRARRNARDRAARQRRNAG